MASDRVIQVKGIKDLQSALRQISKDAATELRLGLNEAAQIVVDAAKPLVPVKSGKAAGSIKVGSTQRAAQIKVGGSAAPYFPWLDFGGSTGKGHVEKVAGSGAIKRPWRGAPNGEGRYIYPTLRAKKTEIVKKVDALLARLAVSAGFETKGSV